MNEVNYTNLVFFDGICNLCNGFVQFLIRHDPHGKLKFTSLQSDFAQKLIHVEYPDLLEMKTIAYLRNGSMLTKSQAALYILKDIGGWPSIAFALMIIPGFIRDFFYGLISSSRYSLFGKSDSCMMPSKELMDRFVL